MTDQAEVRPEELAGRLRVLVGRLNYSLGTPGRLRGATPSRLMALWMLEKFGPMRSGELACRMTITAASTSRLVDAIDEQGWLERRTDPEDRRANLLSVSESGSQMLADLRRESTTQLAEDIAAMSPARQKLLAEALPVLAELADQQLAQARPTLTLPH
jgi:DNA-binding MarR family transcriptional regulator